MRKEISSEMMNVIKTLIKIFLFIRLQMVFGREIESFMRLPAGNRETCAFICYKFIYDVNEDFLMSLRKQTAGVEFDPTKPHQCFRLVNIPNCIVFCLFLNSRECMFVVVLISQAKTFTDEALESRNVTSKRRQQEIILILPIRYQSRGSDNNCVGILWVKRVSHYVMLTAKEILSETPATAVLRDIKRLFLCFFS